MHFEFLRLYDRKRDVDLKMRFRLVGVGLWRALNRIIASYLERLHSKESQSGSPSRSKKKFLYLRQRKYLNVQPYFVVFGVSQNYTHLCCPMQSYNNQSMVGVDLIDVIDLSIGLVSAHSACTLTNIFTQEDNTS